MKNIKWLYRLLRELSQSAGVAFVCLKSPHPRDASLWPVMLLDNMEIDDTLTFTTPRNRFLFTLVEKTLIDEK